MAPNRQPLKNPNSFIYPGIAEQVSVDIAYGIALGKSLPILYGMSPFISARCYEQYKDIFGKSLLNLEPHLLANYLFDLASEFHSYYSNVRIITEDINYSRIYLINSVQKVLKNGLGLLNVSAPTKM